MENKNMKIYDDGSEFLDDIFGFKLTTGLDREQFSNWNYNKWSKIGLCTIEERQYDVISIDGDYSDDLYFINSSKSIFEWYQEWCKIIKEGN